MPRGRRGQPEGGGRVHNALGGKFTIWGIGFSIRNLYYCSIDLKSLALY